VEIDANELTPEIGRAFHGKGVKVQAKTLGKEWDRPEMWDRVVASGADWIQTDYAEELIAREVLRRVPRRPIRISHHRGANRYAPENTLPAFEKSIRMGADFVEFDVRTTSDGRFFLLHDGDLRRTTNRAGAIRDVSSDVVTGLDAGSWFGKPFAGVRSPTLEEFLSAVAGKVDLYFDAKDIAPEALVAALEKHRVTDRTVVYQGVKYLQKLRALNTRVRLLPPLNDLAQLESIDAELHPYAVDTRWEILSKELIDRCHSKGILVFSDLAFL
jgi:glycerophosphoryl diester phosphodiesterase